ncbi:putative leucine-rich repeat receptor-like serine/threonine-protein kinase At3g14840 isoform X1 [Apium graveolens]|uniref:putative leucine-rich repeat receptor-like serine/threonine-protein kinase At3g14840 isoform X1 n=1 Tax=Apium graveolens TaxID=4045 RepID=UPI003D78B738
MLLTPPYFSFCAPLLLLLAFPFFFASAAPILPNDEVEALQKIATTLGKTDWIFGGDSCNNTEGGNNSITCDCTSSNATICHVVGLIFKRQNLAGTLPASELLDLPSLQIIDFSRNYLNGSLPREWGASRLTNITLLGNRLTGTIPKEFGNITTLLELLLDHNQLSGPVPPEIGNLPAIERIILSSNNLNGELPSTYANLTTLKDFRIADTNFTGKIPNFIEKWTNVQILIMQGTRLNGPIPSGIVQLTDLFDLRISDLNGTEQAFPPLRGMKSIKRLVLRSCNIVGQLPEYLVDMKNLTTLDLSFNKISGEIPASFAGLSNTEQIYLSGNMLSGSDPENRMPKGQNNIDLSYNNFTPATFCQQNDINLFASSSTRNISGIVSCLENPPCQRNWHAIHINCGGREVSGGRGLKYEADIAGGPSSFSRSGANWGTSNTGHFMDDSNRKFLTTNISRLYMDRPELYMDARISPISLTYYGFCLYNGNYTVKLHFAEIMFTDDETYNSLGRRIFDVYIQGKLVLKDFNIALEAGGVGKEIIKSFPVTLSSNTLEIRLYWGGKGTTSIPEKGVYGPLISAISVESDSIPSEGKRSVGIIVGIVVAAVSGFVLVLGILWWKGCLQSKNRMNIDLKGVDLQTGSFTLRQIRVATNNFDVANKIGEGGFGPVYKGLLSNGTLIAVKQLSSKSQQGNREFVNEIGMITALQHPHLVKLYGCCIEGNQLLLVYEYLENNSLARALFGPDEWQIKLDWATRYKICTGIAKGLAYLHEESRLKIIHRDIKATNVLLDKELNPKISDFGLAKLVEEEKTHMSTRVAGTYGYMAPEYAMRGTLTDKADVYSFGIVALEIVSGMSNTSSRSEQETLYLLDWAHELKVKGNLRDLVDERLGSEFNEKEATLIINLALLCTNVSPVVRPAMSSVVGILEGRSLMQDYFSDRSTNSEIKQPTDFLDIQQQSYVTSSSGDSQLKDESMTYSWTASPTSRSDLYPINVESNSGK